MKKSMYYIEYRLNFYAKKVNIYKIQGGNENEKNSKRIISICYGIGYGSMWGKRSEENHKS